MTVSASTSASLTEEEQQELDYQAALRLSPPVLRDEAEGVMWATAHAFAREAHGTQRRSYVHEPYWHHVHRVAATVSRVTARTPVMLQAALLHDVVEDTKVTIEQVATAFGLLVAEQVAALTDPPKAFGTRAARKAEVLRKLAHQSAEVHTIKLADLLDNTPFIVDHDPDFARLYLTEKWDLLGVLQRGDPMLWARARDSVTEGQRKLIHRSLHR